MICSHGEKLVDGRGGWPAALGKSSSGSGDARGEPCSENPGLFHAKDPDESK
jgi:hypothetical protein